MSTMEECLPAKWGHSDDVMSQSELTTQSRPGLQPEYRTLV